MGVRMTTKSSLLREMVVIMMMKQMIILLMKLKEEIMNVHRRSVRMLKTERIRIILRYLVTRRRWRTQIRNTIIGRCCYLLFYESFVLFVCDCVYYLGLVVSVGDNGLLQSVCSWHNVVPTALIEANLLIEIIVFCC